jgi:outer membrane lipoprotein SlyB
MNCNALYPVSTQCQRAAFIAHHQHVSEANMENQARSTHPMIIVAATTVTIASLAAIASFAGWIPRTSNTPAPAAQVAVAPAAVPAAIPAPAAAVSADPVAAPAAPVKAAPVHKAAPRKAPPRQADYTYESSSTYSGTRGATPVGNYPMNDSGVYVEGARQPGQYSANTQNSSVCRDCATVESVREVKQDGEGTGLGAISGGVVGGLLGNQIGNGRGRTVGAVVGALGGAYAGNAVEKNVRGTKNYEVTVRLDDGNTRVFTEAQPPSLQRGDRVRVSNGQLSRQ